MSRNVLVFGAHPDDAEIGMGGTIIKLAKSGYDVVLLDLTRGEMSSNGDIHTRKSEADASGQILRISERYNFNLPDRNIECSLKTIECVSAVIRRYDPIMIFYPSSVDPHPDHVAASELIDKSIFHAKLRKFESDHAPVVIKKCYTYSINGDSSSDIYIDISDEYDDKNRALLCYESQFGNENPESKTRLNQGFLEYISARDRQNGYVSGVKYAECFQEKQKNAIKNIAMWEASQYE